ncbi:hypothetical protein [Rasiella sp. SM2506]|uniref:hypothetical protein n=1 Tax=Rasiella sp. SM2506 TaxID=3423914 RepID=UPI003D7BA3C9
MAVPKKSFRSIKINMFFFFLLLAIIFWALTKFSKENSAKIEASLVYTNLPENYLLGDENENSITFDITSNGFNFLVYKMKQPTVSIDVSKYFDDTNKKALLSTENLKEEIAAQISYSGEIRNLSKSGMTLDLEGVQSKKIPVIVNALITYKKGFKKVDTLTPSPDSISVAGPKKLLDSIVSITTNELVLQNVDKNISNKITLEKLPFAELYSKTKDVVVKQTVKEFAQKKLVLPIKLINVPKQTTLKIIPERIEITFIVPIEKFASIIAQDFEIVCDYKQRNTEENFLTPTLVSAPKEAKNIEMLTKKIDFLIFK